MRLIDADAFKEKFKQEHEFAFNPAEAMVVRKIFAELDETPTAYDVDKVVKQVQTIRHLPKADIVRCIRKGGVK